MVYLNHFYCQVGTVSLTVKTGNAPIIRRQFSPYNLKVFSGAELGADIAPLAVIVVYSDFALFLMRHDRNIITSRWCTVNSRQKPKCQGPKFK